MFRDVKKNANKNTLFTAIAALLILLFTEASFRTYFWKTKNMPWHRPDMISHWYYADLFSKRAAPVSQDDGYFDILILGGSSVTQRYGQIPQELEKVFLKSHPKVRVHNAAFEGHSSRDSRLKYQVLRGKPYELILVYDGINDTRANNIDARYFKPNYNHYAWYEEVNAIFGHPELLVTVVPFTLHWSWIQIFRDPNTHIHQERISTENVPFGKEIKTAKSFEANLSAIAVMAGTTPIMIPRFVVNRLSHAPGAASPWGQWEYVLNAVDVHNDVIQNLSTPYPNIIVIPMDKRIVANREHLYDECHFTPKGSERFAYWVHEAANEGVLY